MVDDEVRLHDEAPGWRGVDRFVQDAVSSWRCEGLAMPAGSERGLMRSLGTMARLAEAMGGTMEFQDRHPLGCAGDSVRYRLSMERGEPLVFETLPSLTKWLSENCEMAKAAVARTALAAATPATGSSPSRSSRRAL